jgi:hypothetical protein
VVAVLSMSKPEFSRLEVRLTAEVRNPGKVDRALPGPCQGSAFRPAVSASAHSKSSPVKRELRRGYGALGNLRRAE